MSSTGHRAEAARAAANQASQLLPQSHCIIAAVQNQAVAASMPPPTRYATDEVCGDHGLLYVFHLNSRSFS